MQESTVTKIRNFLLYLMFILISFLLAYALVYKLQYYPNGYKVISVEETAISVQPYSFIGTKEEVINYEPVEDRQWTIEYIVDLIDDIKLQLLLFFTVFIFSLFLLLYRLKHEEKIIHAFFKSGLFAALLAYLPYLQLLDRIETLLLT